MSKYIFFDRDVSEEEDRDITDDHYEKLITICCKYSAYLSLRITGDNINGADELEKYRVQVDRDFVYMYGHFYREYSLQFYSEVRYYRVCPELRDLLLKISDSVFKWINGWGYTNPDDPVFYRADGSVFFSSVIHDGECLLHPNDDEDVSEIVLNDDWIKFEEFTDGDITKKYFAQCKARYVPLGFRRSRQTYARIVNDVLQTFTFRRYNSGRDCTVNFGVFPLCEAREYPDRGRYNLGNFKQLTCYADWPYDRNSDLSMTLCVRHICSFIDRYLLPFFAETDCSEKALPALIALDRHFHNVRQEALLWRKRIEEQEEDWREVPPDCDEKFFMALKCGQYDYAKEAAQVLIPSARPECKKLYQSIIEQLEAGNTAYVEDVLRENEQNTLSNLEKCFFIDGS